VFFDPRLLNGMAPVRGQPFDRRHALAGDVGDRDAARARGLSVNMNGARAALRKAAAEFGAGEAERVAEHPEKWHLCRNIHSLSLAVQCEIDSHRHPPATALPQVKPFEYTRSRWVLVSGRTRAGTRVFRVIFVNTLEAILKRFLAMTLALALATTVATVGAQTTGTTTPSTAKQTTPAKPPA